MGEKTRAAERKVARETGKVSAAQISNDDQGPFIDLSRLLMTTIKVGNGSFSAIRGSSEYETWETVFLAADKKHMTA